MTVSEFRTRNIHENFCPIFNDIQVDKKIVIRCNDYFSSDNQSAFYETNIPEIAARVYYDKKSLTKPENQARSTIFSVCTGEIPYMYYSDSVCSLDIIPNTSALKSQYTYDQLKQTVIPQINNLLKRLSSCEILHRSLTNRSFGISTQDKIVLIDFSSVIQIPDKRIELEDKQAKGSGVFCSYESLRGTYYLEKSDYYSFGIIIASLYLGKIPKDTDELKDLISTAPHDLKLLIKLLTDHDHTNRGNSATVDDWLSMPVKRFIEKYKNVNDQVEFTFLGETYTSRYELSSALAKNWENAKIHLHTNSLIDFLNRQSDQDLAAKIISSILDDDSDDLKFAKCLYLFDGSGRFFWKRAFNSANELLKSEYLREIILSDYLIWILEQNKESSQKINTQRQLKEITELNTDLGLALAKFVFSFDEIEYPMPHEFFSERFSARNIRESDITNDVLAYLIFNGEFENVKEYINTRSAYQEKESNIINFYRYFEHSIQEESYKKIIRTHFIEYGPYAEHIRIRSYAKGYQYYDGSDVGIVVGTNYLPTANDSIEIITKNCHRYYSAVREFEKNAVFDRFSAYYGLYNIHPKLIVPNNYGSAFRNNINYETIKANLKKKADVLRKIESSIDTDTMMTRSFFSVTITAVFLWLIFKLPSETILQKSLVGLSFLLLFLTAVGIPKVIKSTNRLKEIKSNAMNLVSTIERKYIPNIERLNNNLLQEPAENKISYTKNIERKREEFETLSDTLKGTQIYGKAYVIIWMILSVITVFVFGLTNNAAFANRNLNFVCKIIPSLDNYIPLAALKIIFCVLVFISFIILIGFIIYLLYSIISEDETEVEKTYLSYGLGVFTALAYFTGMLMPIIVGILLILLILIIPFAILLHFIRS